MTTVRNLVPHDFDAAEGFCRAIDAYKPYIWTSIVTRERFPLDALVFAGHQTPWTSYEKYQEERCKYDFETNNWLVWYVSQMAEDADKLPPVLLRITPTGVDLVDGCHRASALLMLTDRAEIDAWVIQ